MYSNKIFLVLVLLFSTAAFGSTVDYTRKAIFTVEADPASSSGGSVTLTIGGVSKVFSFSGSSWSMSSTRWEKDVTIGSTYNMTVSSSNISDFRIHGKRNSGRDNLSGFYLEMGDDSKSSVIDKSEAGSSFPFRVRSGLQTRSNKAGDFDYERSFTVGWWHEERPLSRSVRISLGADSAGNSQGILSFTPDYYRSQAVDGINYYKGVSSLDSYSLPNSGRQVANETNVVNLVKGSTSKKAKIIFYPKNGATFNGSYWVTSASAILEYEVEDTSTNFGNRKAIWKRTIGSEVKRLDFNSYKSYSPHGSGNDVNVENRIDVKPWYDASGSPTRTIRAISGYYEVEYYYPYYPYYVSDILPKDWYENEVLDSSNNVVQSSWRTISGSLKKGSDYMRIVNATGSQVWYHGQGETTTTDYDNSNIGSQPKAAIGSPKSVASTFLDADGALVTNFEYDEVYHAALPSKIEAKKGSTTVSLETNTYVETDFPNTGGADAVRKTSVLSTGSGSLTTVTLSYATHVADPFLSGKPLSIERPDGTKTSYGYERGTWSGSAWSASSSGADLRVIEVNGVKTSVSVPFSYADVDGFDGIDIDDVRLQYLPNPADVGTGELSIETVYSRFGEAVRERSLTYVNGAFHVVSTKIKEYTELGQLKKVHDPDTQLVHYEASFANGEEQWEQDLAGTRTTFVFDDDTGLVESMTKEASGSSVPAVTTTYEYDAASRPTKVTVGGTLVTDRVYDVAGRITSEKTPGGYETTYSYSYSTTGASSVTKTNPDGSTEVTEIHRDGAIKSISGTGVPDTTYTYVYSGSDLLTKETLPGGMYTETRTDMAGRIQEILSPQRGGGTKKTKHVYNSSGQLVREEYLDGSTHIAPSKLYQYDEYGRLWLSALDTDNDDSLDLSTDASAVLHQRLYLRYHSSAPNYLDDNVWYYRYATLHYTEEDSSAWRVGTFDCERLSDLDANNVSYRAFRDNEDNWTMVTTSVAQSNNEMKVASNVPGSSTDTETVYRSGALISEKNAQGHTTTFKYDSVGRLLETVDPKGYDTDIGYLTGTALPSTVTENDGMLTTFGYDSSSGVQNYVKDDLGNESFSHLDPVSRTSYTWGSGTKSTKTIYDELGRMIELHTYRTAKSGYAAMSGVGDKTTWSYDATSGVLLSETDAQNRKVEYTSHDAAGRVLQMKDPRGAKTNYTYYGPSDAAAKAFTGLLKEVDYDLSQAPGVRSTGGERYEYHQRMLLMTKMRQESYGGSGVWRDWVYEWDDGTGEHQAGRLLSETLPNYYYGYIYNKINYSYQTDSGAFDPNDHDHVNGRLSSFNVGSSSNYENSYVYSSLGRLESVYMDHLTASPVNDLHADYVYFSNSNLIEKIVKRDGTQSRHKEQRYFASDSYAITQVRTHGFLGDIHATHTNVTDVRTVRDDLRRINEHKINGWIGTQSSGGSSGIFESYIYTTRGELDVATTKLLNSNWSGGSQIRYKNRNYDAMGNRTDGFSADSLNRYATLSNNGLSINATYDAAGNLTYDGEFEYFYNAKNELDYMYEAGQPQGYSYAHFEYDPLGRRISKWGKGSNSQTFTRKFMYQGWNLIAEFESSLGSPVKKYTWGLDASGTLQGAGGVGGLLLIEVKDGSDWDAYYPVYDARKNVIGLQDAEHADEALVAWYDYDPFGRLIGSGGAAADLNPFRFSTKYTDFELSVDQVYYGLRYYHAEIGRFLNRDPIGIAGGTNLYAFVENDPVNNWDLLGLQTKGDSPDNPVTIPIYEYWPDGNPGSNPYTTTNSEEIQRLSDSFQRAGDFFYYVPPVRLRSHRENFSEALIHGFLIDGAFTSVVELGKFAWNNGLPGWFNGYHMDRLTYQLNTPITQQASDTLNGVTTGLKSWWKNLNTTRGAGKAIFDLVTALIPATKASKLDELAELGNLTKGKKGKFGTDDPDAIAEHDPVTGEISYNKANIRKEAEIKGTSWRHEARAAAYHEHGHHLLNPVNNAVQRLFGLSHQPYFLSRTWRAAEEAIVETYGQIRARIRSINKPND